MGVNTRPDIFQRIMYELLGAMTNRKVYSYDILLTSNGTFEEHAAIMEIVLERLQMQILEQILKKRFFLVNPKLIIQDMKSLEILFNHNLRKWKR
jgi:hypothetical protein